jgi:predicted nucleotidyltransferase
MFKGRTKPFDPTEGVTRSLLRNIPEDYPRILFKDVTKEAGITFRHFSGERTTLLPEDMGSGAAWGDYDSDGDLDLYVVNESGPITLNPEEMAQGPANALYRNNGDGTFTDVAPEAGVDSRGNGMGAAWGDYDGDSDLDLYVTYYGPNILYRNNGNGTFTDVSEKAGVGDEGFGAGVTWGDYDRDGDLDLYVTNYVEFQFDETDLNRESTQYGVRIPHTLNPSSYDGGSNLLYRNNGNGTFTEIAKELGVDNPKGKGLAVTFCDFDGDRYPDIYVANDVSENAMFRNKGDGTFEDIGASSWAADYRGAMGLAVGDYDNDGDIDFFLTHWIAQENTLYNNLLVEYRNVEPNQLRFQDMADRVGLGEIALDFIGWGTDFFDYDNDGRLDLFVANGSTFENPKNTRLLLPQKNLLFWNKGEEGFFEVSAVSGDALARENVGRGATFGDYDGDGDVDIFIVVNGGPGILLQNEGGNENNWLKLKTRGVKSNRYGIGARVRATINGMTHIREVGAGTSYLSQNSIEVEFGLGKAETVELIEIDWPSGIHQKIENIAANQTLVVTETPSL